MSATPWTPGKWEWWTSCSWRRLRSNNGYKTLDVLMPCVHSDGHPDIIVSEADRRLIQHAPDMAEALAELVLDMTICMHNMEHAAKTDPKWEGCAELIKPRVDAASAILARIRGDAP